MTAVIDALTPPDTADGDAAHLPESERVEVILNRVRGLTDPVERCRQAAVLELTSKRVQSYGRAIRDNAAMVAHLDYGVQPVRLYRDALGGLSRGLFNRMVQRANYISPLPALRTATGLPLGTAEELQTLTREFATTVRVYTKVAKGARLIRDDTGRGLMNGDYGTPMSNADFARLTGLSSARAAQIRYGKNGHNPKGTRQGR